MIQRATLCAFLMLLAICNGFVAPRLAAVSRVPELLACCRTGRVPGDYSIGRYDKQTKHFMSTNSDDPDEMTPDGGDAVSNDKKASFWSKFKGGDSDGLTTKERIAKMGMSALLSYGWVSNMSMSVTVSSAWFVFSKKTGLSPLAPGQWKPFLAIYAGFYVFNNIVRPVRFGIAAVVSNYFDSFVKLIQRKTQLSKKQSIALIVFLVNICGTFAALGLGISLASFAAGVPIFPAKA